MGQSSLTGRWIRFSAVSLLAILTLFGSYFFVYVGWQQEYYLDYYQRILSQGARKVQKSLQVLHENVENAVTDDDYSTKNPRRKVSNYLDQVSLLETQWERPGISEEISHRDQLVQIDLTWRDGRSSLVFWINMKKAAMPHDGQTGAAPGCDGEPVCGRMARLDELLEDVGLGQGREELEAVFLIDKQGRELARKGSRHLALSGLNLKKLQENPQSLGQQPQANGSNKAAEKADGNSQSRADAVQTVQVNGVPYKLFAQPVLLPFAIHSTQTDRTADPETWLLVGLMSESAFLSRSMAISPNFLLAGIGLLILALLFMPYLKLRYIGPRETLQSHDVLVLAVSITVLCAFLTYMVLDISSLFLLRGKRDEALEDFSRQIQISFSQELVAMDQQLRVLTKSRDKWHEKHQRERWWRWEIQNFLGARKRRLVQMIQGKPSRWSLEALYYPLLEAAADDYPLLEMAFWIDCKGEIVEEWHSGNSRTPFINLSSRAYFQHALRQETWRPSWQNHGGLYLQSIRSRATGKVAAVISHHIPNQRECLPDEHQARVAGLLAPMLSLTNPVVPPGLGFAIVEPTGQVLFHSESFRNLRENIFEQVNPREGLEAAVSTKAVTLLNGEHHGRRLRIRVSPLLEDVPWALLVFADMTPIHTVMLDVRGFGFLAFSAYLAFFLAVAVGLHKSRSRYRWPGVALFKWYWPQKKRLGDYLCLIFQMALMTAAWLALWQWGQPKNTALISALLGIVALATIQHRLRNTSICPAESLKDKRLRVYGVFWVALAVFMYFCPEKVAAWWAALLVLWALCLVAHRNLTVAYWMAIVHLLLTAGYLGWQSEGAVELTVSAILIPLLVAAQRSKWGTERYQFEAPADWENQNRCQERRLDRSTARLQKQSLRHWKKAYSMALFFFLIIAAVLPTAAFFRTAFDEGVLLFQMSNSQEMAQALEDRQKRIQDRYEKMSINPESREKLLEKLAPARQCSEFLQNGKSLAAAWDVYQVEGRMEPKVTCSSWSSQTKNRSCTPVQDAPQAPSMTRWLERFLPALSLQTYKLRSLAEQPGAGSHTWRLCRTDDGLQLRMVEAAFPSLPRLGSSDAAYGSGGGSQHLEISGALERLSAFSLGWKLWLIALAGLMVLWQMIRSVVFRTFLISMRHPRSLELYCPGNGPPDRNLLVLRQNWSWPQAHEIDASKIVTATELDTVLKKVLRRSDKTVVAVKRFHVGLEDRDAARMRLQLLERLQAARMRIVILTDIEPLHSMTHLCADLQRRDPECCKPDLGRWAAALEGFTMVRRSAKRLEVEEQERDFAKELREVRPSRFREGDQARKGVYPYNRLPLLARECWPDGRLRDIALQLVQLEGLRDLDNKRLYEQIYDLAEPYYRRIWSQCSTDEKVLLHSIAEEGFVNWNRTDHLRRLIRRGLVIASPNFRLMNQSFTRFVRHAEVPEVWQEWKGELGESSWARLRLPLGMALATLAVFFFATQRETFYQTIGIATAFAAAVPAVIKLVAMLQHQRS